MPTYDYKCTECEHCFELFKRSMGDPDPESCPECKGKVRRAWSSPALHLPSVQKDRKMKDRYKKRNAKIEKMDPVAKKKMSDFMDKRNVKKYLP